MKTPNSTSRIEGALSGEMRIPEQYHGAPFSATPLNQGQMGEFTLLIGLVDGCSAVKSSKEPGPEWSANSRRSVVGPLPSGRRSRSIRCLEVSPGPKQGRIRPTV